MDGGDEEETRAIAGYIPDPERPSRIARRRAETARAARMERASATPDEAAAGGSLAPSPEASPGAAGEGAAPSAVLAALRVRELEAALVELSTQVRMLVTTWSAGRPARFSWAANFSAAILAGLAAGGLVGALLVFRLHSLEEDVQRSLERTDGLEAELARQLDEARADRDRAQKEAAARVEAIEREGAVEREAAAAWNPELVEELKGYQERLAEIAREQERLRVAEQNRRLNELIAEEEKRLQLLPEKAHPPKGAVPSETVEPPPGATEQRETAKEEERTPVERLNALLAAQDGARLYRIAGAGACRGGWLEDPILRVFSQEGEIVEEIRAARLAIELSRKDRMAALDLYECERRFRREARDEIVNLPNHHVEFFDVDTDVWARETEELAKWRE